MTDFTHSLALVIGIDAYDHGIPRLTTAVNDATRLAELLRTEHGYETILLTEPAIGQPVTRERLHTLFTKDLKARLGEDDRLLVYFAGHGVALDGDDGPRGYLVPQDARPGDSASMLPMTDLHAWLTALPCRHMLAILDCCFAGAFRWSATRDLGALPDVIHKERYDRYLLSPAWQVLTSAAYDQKALDVLGGNALGRREAAGRRHSPFALALFDALEKGDADLIPKGQGDGVITATELYLYLRQQVEVQAEVQANHEQTPGLWPLNKHRKGEFIFLAPGHPLNLPPAPDLTEDANPYRGLESYDQKHVQLFFGREDEIKELATLVDRQPFVAVLGASGTGKSSLVKAGVLPRLQLASGRLQVASDEAQSFYYVLPPMRPTDQPVRALETHLKDLRGLQDLGGLAGDDALAQIVAGWAENHPGQRLVLTIDQFEELATLCRDDAEREHFLRLLATAVRQQPDVLRLIITLRTDFEPQFTQKGSPLAEAWGQSRYVVPPMDIEDLRQVIEGPASVRVLYFDPPELVDDLIKEVIQTPGALPLLSFTLSELYVRYVRSGRDDRALAGVDYRALGGVVGSLRNRATEEYDNLPDDAHRATMQRVMLRMVAVEGGELARRRVALSELEYPTGEENARVQAVLDRLVDARLLVRGMSDSPTGSELALNTVNGQALDTSPREVYIEPAHDALVLAWDRLLTWKREAEDYLPLQRRLAQAATEWRKAGPESRSGLLWDDDPRLPQVEQTLWPAARKQKGLSGSARRARRVLTPNAMVPADTKWLNGSEVTFVRASVARRASTLRRIIGITAAVIVALTGLALLASYQATQATQQRNEANAQRDNAVRSQATAVAEGNARATEVVVRSTAEANARRSAQAEATAAADAKQKQAQAEREARRARAGELTVLAENSLATNPDLALLLAKLAVSTTYQVDRTAEPRAEAVLYRSLSSPFEHAMVKEETLQTISDYQSVLLDPTGSRLVPLGNRASLWDTGGRFLREIGDHALKFAPDGSLVATVTWDQTTPDSPRDVVKVWDRNGVLVAEPSSPFQWVNDVAFSPDVRTLVVAGYDNDSAGVPILLWNLVSHEQRQIGSFQPAVSRATFDPANRERIMLLSGDSAELWDTETGPVQLLSRDGDEVDSATFSSTGEHILTITKDHRARLWDSNGQYLQDLGAKDGTIVSAAFSPDGRSILVLDAAGFGRLHDLNGGQTAQLEAPGTGITSARFSPDGGKIIGFTEDGKTGVWTLDGALLTSVDGNLADFSPLGDQLLTANLMQEDKVRVWSLSGELIAEFQAHSGSLVSAEFSPDGRVIVTSGCDSPTQFRGCSKATTRLWSIVNLSRAQSTSRVNNSGSSPAFLTSPDGSHIVISTQREGSRTTLWNTEAQTEVEVQLGATATRWLGVGKDGTRAIGLSCRQESNPTAFSTWCDSPTLIRVGLDDGQIAGQLALHSGTGDLNSLLVSSTGTQVVADSAPETMAELNSPLLRWIWNTQEDTWHPIQEAEGWGAFSPDESHLAMVNEDGLLRLWDISGHPIMSTTLNLGYDVPSFESLVVFSPNGKRLAVSLCTDMRMASCDDATVWTWNLELNSTKVISASYGSVSALAFGPDSTLLAIANGDDHAVQVWAVDAPSGRDLRPGPKGSGVRTEKVLFSPDGSKLATVGGDGFELWDLQGNPLASVRAYPDGIDDASFVVDGKSFVTIGCNHRDDETFQCLDSRVKIWKVFDTTEALLIEAERRLGDRDFTQGECQDYLKTEECSP